MASDWNSADARTVNVGSGGRQDDIAAGAASSAGLREPATADSDVRTAGDRGVNTAGSGVGRSGELGGLPNDAVSRDKKDKSGTVDTTGADYGYPQKSDPSNKQVP